MFFLIVVVPPFFENPDLLRAFSAGFVNPFAIGFSTDVLVCWGILAAWITHEARVYSVRCGWICLLLGVVPGVSVGFAVYLLIRTRQLESFMVAD
ncbi:DUF2834 domain-containing protein [Marinobacter nauticus]|uniref:DUF2834 domain-containing protein n=1 Tax=Marinobacter nauticus TaxID=2743 RepID=UPI0039A58DD1